MGLTNNKIIDSIVLNRLIKYKSSELSVDNIKNSCYVFFKKSFIDIPANIEELIKLSIISFSGLSESQLHEKTLENILKKTEYTSKFELPAQAVLRYAVNPNYEPTLGNLRGISIHVQLAKLNTYLKPKIYLRFDDTDPYNKPSTKKGYLAYIAAAKWLGLNIDETYYASERCELYYDYARQLLIKNIAYISNTLTPFSIDLFNEMITKKTNHVLKIKNTIKDWVAFRYVLKPHVITNTKILFWPTLNFQSFVDDFGLHVTHIFRGKDLRNTEQKQAQLFSIFNKTYPICTYWGRNRLQSYKLSSSKLVKLKDIYSATHLSLSNLIYYQISPIALNKFFIELGLTEVDSIFNIAALKAHQTHHKNNLKFVNLKPVLNNYLVYFTEHMTDIIGYLYVDYSFKKLKKYSVNTIFKIHKAYYKINPNFKIIKLLY